MVMLSRWRKPPRLVVRLLAPLLGLLCSALALAQQDPPPAPGEPTNARPFLWRIDGQVPSYLFGTFHLPDDRVMAVHPLVDRVLGKSDAVFTEIDMSTTISPALMKAMRLPAGKSLRDVVPADLLQRAEKRLGGAGTLGQLELRPFVVSVQVLVGGRKLTGEALDLQIYKDARSAGKEVGGLETVEEQMSAMGCLGIDGEVGLLKLTLDILDNYEKRGLDLCDEMIKAYCAGDTQKTLAFFEEMNGDRELWSVMSRALLTDRNLRMAERIDRMIHAQPGRKFLFAVGTGHLIGETDVVDLLRTRGYTVTRVPETTANLDEELEELQRDIAKRQARIQLLQEKKAALAKTGVKKAG